VINDGNVKLLKKISKVKLMDTTTKERLRKKLKNKKEQRSGKLNTEKVDEDNLFNMLNQVNKMLKENPQMVKKVSKCVNSIFENKDLMNSLVSEIESNVQDSQALESKSEEQDVAASSKESVQ
jgi:3-hydroxyacyl-CoA dehydrogenase